MEHNNIPAMEEDGSNVGNGARTRQWTLEISPSTGGQFKLDVPCEETVDGLKKRLAKKLKAPKEKLMLLFKDRQLRDGTLESNALSHGSRLVLLPAVESGLLSHRHDPTLLQALENLTDDQINDFLSGRSPLTLALRLGDHMVFVQLQLASAVGSKGAANNKTCCQTVHPARASPCQQQPSTSKPPHPPLQAQNCYCHGNRSTSSSSPSSSSTPVRAPSPAAAAPAATPAATPASTPASTAASTPASHSCRSQPRPSSRSAGAVIESVKQHAPGIFSGTFSGSLSPAVQDKDGRPKRDLNTIMHILTDLLAAAPMYKQHAQQVAHHQQKQHHPQQSTHKLPTSQHHRRPRSVDEKIRIHQENCHTRTKMEQLQTMMRARQMRRKARREMRAPWADTRSSGMMDGSSVMLDATLEKTVSENCFTDLQQEFIVA